MQSGKGRLSGKLGRKHYIFARPLPKALATPKRPECTDLHENVQKIQVISPRTPIVVMTGRTVPRPFLLGVSHLRASLAALDISIVRPPQKNK